MHLPPYKITRNVSQTSQTNVDNQIHTTSYICILDLVSMYLCIYVYMQCIQRKLPLSRKTPTGGRITAKKKYKMNRT